MAVSIEDVQAVGAFTHLSTTHQDLIAGLLVKRHYAPGEMIFLEGDPTRGIWFILEGHVRIIKFSEGGRVQALCLVNKGKCFGGCPLFSMEKNPANAQAMDDVTLLILSHQETAYLRQNNPQLMQILLQIYSDRLALLAHLSESLGAWSVNARINDTLLRHIEENSQRIVYLTHEKIAHLAGTVREVVSRHLSDLEAQQIIRQQPGMIELLKVEELQSVCILNNR